MAGMRGYVQLNKHAHHLNSLKQHAGKLGGRRPGSPRGTVASASKHEDAQLGHDTPAEEKKNDDRGGHANEPQSPSVPAEETEAQANPAVAEGGVETPTVSPAFRGRASVDGNPAGRGDRGSRRREPEGMRRMAASVLSTSSYLVIVQESHLPCCRVIRCSFCICLGSIFNLSVFFPSSPQNNRFRWRWLFSFLLSVYYSNRPQLCCEQFWGYKYLSSAARSPPLSLPPPLPLFIRQRKFRARDPRCRDQH